MALSVSNFCRVRLAHLLAFRGETRFDTFTPSPMRRVLPYSVKTANPKRMGAIERHPHYVTRRYAHFAASLLALHSGLDDHMAGIGGEEMLLNDLATLRVEVRSKSWYLLLPLRSF